MSESTSTSKVTWRKRVKYSTLSRHFWVILCSLVGVDFWHICMLCGRPFKDGCIIKAGEGIVLIGHAACIEDNFDAEPAEKGETWQSPTK